MKSKIRTVFKDYFFLVCGARTRAREKFEARVFKAKEVAAFIYLRVSQLNSNDQEIRKRTVVEQCS